MGRYGGQEGPTGTSFIFFLIVSTFLSFSFFFFPVASFLQSTAIGGAGRGVTDAGGTTYCLRPPQEVGGGNGYVFRYFFIYSPLLLFSSSYCSYYPIISFFALINNRKFGVGSNAGWRNNGVRLLFFFCSPLFFFSLFFRITYLLFCEVGLDRQHSGRQHVDRRRNRRQRIVYALFERSVFCRFSFSVLFYPLFLFSDYLFFRED